MEDIGTFVRELELPESKSLKLYQKEIGDVSCVVWDAAIVLAKYLDVQYSKNSKWLKGRTVVELGAGVGCVGLMAAVLGSHVILTDLPEVLPLLELNIKANEEVWGKNGGTANFRALEWGKGPNLEPVDVLLLADCVYYDESLEPLISTICALSKDSTEVLISQEERPSSQKRNLWAKFIRLLSEYFDINPVSKEDQHQWFHSSDIYVLKAKKKIGS